MKGYKPEIHHRRSIRLKGYDYSRCGAYFVTCCTRDRECLFGRIEDAVMLLNDAGKMIAEYFGNLEGKFPDLHCGPFVVMPNHFHCIIIKAGNEQYPSTGPSRQAGTPIYSGIKEWSLPQAVQWFKTMTTNRYIQGVKNYGWHPFRRSLWQRNYWEHIIRNEESFRLISEYIINNPAKWEFDKLNKDRG